MPLWKVLLLNLYYHASGPARAWTYRRLLARNRVPAIILYWHRIDDDCANPWTTSREVFSRQIYWLQKRFQFVSLEEVQRRVRSGGNREPCVSVTFDDGYADNCRHAIPLLVKERIPCTYFVTVQNILEGQAFAHDRKQGRSIPPNTVEELRAMAASGVEIGSHAFTHANLGAIADPRQLRREVVETKAELENMVGRTVRYFAFPYGLRANLSRTVFEMAKASGYAGVCSAYGGFNFPNDDAFHLQRISADGSVIRMKNWVTLDPRKMRVPRFSYSQSSSSTSADDGAEVSTFDNYSPGAPAKLNADG
jgi:peptidoglycan/xylan/chitin deacetylase (PgdA/CDA1 family)